MRKASLRHRYKHLTRVLANVLKPDIGAAFARRSVGVRLEHNHPEWACRVGVMIDKGHGGSGVVGAAVSSDVPRGALAPAVRD